MLHQAYFVIADITGYTAFMTGSELEHAQDILKTLFDTLLDNIKPPLIVSNFQGDAILTYAPEGSFSRGETLLETIETIYCEFSHTLENMHRNTTCTCRACANIPKLDLKLFVHHGEYVIQDMRGKSELSGPDVIVAHRMMKNDVKEKTGLKAYTLFTEAAVNGLGLADFTCEMKSHSETYDHIGEVKMYAYCLKTLWAQEREKRRVFITPEAAYFFIEGEVDAPPALVWDYLNDPAHLQKILGVEGVSATGIVNGRQKTGSVLHCAHGTANVTDFKILDIKPFDYRTDNVTGLPMGMRCRITTWFKPTDKGTKVIWALENITGSNFISNMMARLMQSMLRREFSKDYRRVHTNLRNLIETPNG